MITVLVMIYFSKRGFGARAMLAGLVICVCLDLGVLTVIAHNFWEMRRKSEMVFNRVRVVDLGKLKGKGHTDEHRRAQTNTDKEIVIRVGTDGKVEVIVEPGVEVKKIKK